MLVRAVLGYCAAAGAETRMFDGPFLAQLPHYDPAGTERNAAEAELVEAVRSCDALVIASPGYHGGVSGLVENAIDLLEELRQDSRPYFDGRAVGLIVSAAGCSVWSPRFRDVTPAALAEARSLGLRLIPWTVNEPSEMARLIALGVDGIITDYPNRLRAVMEQRQMPLPPPVDARWRP